MKTNRPRQNAEQWAKIIEQFNHSDLSVKAFCDQNDLALSSFHKWHRKMRLQNNDTPTAFKQITATAPNHRTDLPTSNNTIVTLNISDNMVLTIQSGNAAS